LGKGKAERSPPTGSNEKGEGVSPLGQIWLAAKDSPDLRNRGA